jgi:hypothetical protein
MKYSTTVKRALQLPLLITTLLLPVTACSSTADDSGEAPSKSTARPSKSTETPSRTAISSPSPQRPSAPPALSAADGSDLKACRDADCEIVIRGAAHIPLDPKLGVTRFLLTYVSPNEVTFEVDRAELNSVSGYIKGTGFLGLTNGVKVTVKKINASGAVLRFEPKTTDPDNNQVSASEGGAVYGS